MPLALNNLQKSLGPAAQSDYISIKLSKCKKSVDSPVFSVILVYIERDN